MRCSATESEEEALKCLFPEQKDEYSRVVEPKYLEYTLPMSVEGAAGKSLSLRVVGQHSLWVRVL